MTFKKISFTLLLLLSLYGTGSLSGQVVIGNLPATLAFCEGDTLLETLSPPSISGTYIAGSGVWTIDKVLIPDDYIVSYYDTARILYYRISILAGTANTDTAYIYSTGQELTVKDAPELTRLSLESKPCVGDTIGVKVETNERYPTYQWFLDNMPLTNAVTDSLIHKIETSDIGKILSVEVMGQNGCASNLQTVLTSAAGSVTLPRSLDVEPTDFTNFPITTGLDFEDPVIDYKSTSSYYFVTYDDQNHVDGETKSIYVPYLGDHFTCNVKLLNPGDMIPAAVFAANRTVFLDNAGFTFAVFAPHSPFELHDDIRIIGVDTAANGWPQAILVPYIGGISGNSGYRFRFLKQNSVLQNVIIDGNKQVFHQYLIHVGYGTDGLLMKDIRIRNVGPGGTFNSTYRGVFNIFQGNLREPNAKRYFINITVENSIATYFNNDIINISTADGVYFRNLEVLSTAGYYTIAIAHGSNAYSDNTGGKNVIFAGTLKLPPTKANQIGILRYSSRKISFPKEYRYARVNYNWSATTTFTSGSAIFLSSTYTPNTNPGNNHVLLDLEEDAFIINTALPTSFNTQLARLQSLYNHTATRAACDLPDPLNIKIAPFPSTNITIPDFGEKITHAIFTETTGTSIATTDLIPYTDSNQTITTASSASIDYVRIHNLDFHAHLQRTLTSVKGLFPAGTTSGIFQNCKFSGLETTVGSTDLVINASPVMEATFTEDGRTIHVNSEVGTTLYIEAVGTFPMDVIYAINGVDQPAVTLSSSPCDVIVPTGLATGTYTYTLKEIVGGSACCQVSGEVIIHILNCDDATHTLTHNPIIVELAYGEHSRDIELDTPTVTKPAMLDVTLTSNAPGKTVNLPAGVHRYEWTSTSDCDPLQKVKCTQYVIVNHSPCGNGDDYWTIEGGVPVQTPRPPYTVTDNEGHVYNTVYVSGHCWTVENLISTEYSDGTPIDGTYKYYSPMYPDSNANADVFGLLYNWEAAARPSAGTAQGACPAGWRLPTEDDYLALNMHPALDLRSPNYWLVPGTNLTGFTALPAGMYDGVTNSFYHLMGDAYFWSTAGASLQRKSSLVSYSCDEVQIIDVRGGVGLSIRCVKE
ncbi:MAG: fibrobacter succinogenes major paralogous domain-containing protein [Bacteroidales bacterium]|nr:fibrobacter succinogenes major paralogous domain-containing protein [Bacteroidales bacterium]